ncbi:MAG: hypothetical protein R3C39_09735 [Dehalococcoidia bacterium]
MASLRSLRAPLRAAAATAALALVMLLASACSTGEAGEPHEELAALSDRMSAATVELSFPWDEEAPADGGLAAPTATEGPGPGGTAIVGNTGGTGVSLRSGCADDLRIDGAWGDGVELTIVEFGADECAGWTYLSDGQTESWVRDEYLVDLSAPSAEGGGATVEDPLAGPFKRWTEQLLDGSGRAALLARHVPNSSEATPTAAFLRDLASDMQGLETELTAADPFALPACELARGRLGDAAGDLEALATALARFFDGSTRETGEATAAADRYLETQEQAAASVNECLGGNA